MQSAVFQFIESRAGTSMVKPPRPYCKYQYPSCGGVGDCLNITWIPTVYDSNFFVSKRHIHSYAALAL